MPASRRRAQKGSMMECSTDVAVDWMFIRRASRRVCCGRRRKAAATRRTFGAFAQDLLSLLDWLKQGGVTHVAMESTGVYWKPVWNILEGHLEQVRLVNAQHIKAVPGSKTDQKDSEWIADLLQRGLLRGSVMSPRPSELRDLTGYRVSLAEECNRISNRIQKVLEDANIKLASVASDALGTGSGHARANRCRGRGQ